MSRHGIISTAAILGVVALIATGCAESRHEENMAAKVSVKDQWAKSAETGTTAVFGTFENSGDRGARIVSGTSPASETVELHEVVPNGAGSNIMRPKEGGFTIPAGGSHELIPGGAHLMLMDLKGPLSPGADVTVTLEFEDGSTLPVTAQVRDFAGGEENYQPATPHDHG